MSDEAFERGFVAGWEAAMKKQTESAREKDMRDRVARDRATQPLQGWHTTDPSNLGAMHR